MTFGLTGWLKSQHRSIDYEIPLWYPSKEHPDSREWLSTNGLGGYSMGTVSGMNRRRYHASLVAATTPPIDRKVVLSRIEELVTIDGKAFDLATNSWASGVVSPTGYKKLDCFTTLPTPTWVYDLDGHYLIKRQALPYGKNELFCGYTFLPENDNDCPEVKLTTRFLVGFRDFHAAVKGSSDDRFPQFVSPNQTMIILNESGHRLCLTWASGKYETEKQWWWDYNWPDETARGEPDREDLFLVGTVTSTLNNGQEFSVGASFEQVIQNPNCFEAVERLIERQNRLINRASLPRSQKTDMLILACDQMIVPDVFAPAHSTSLPLPTGADSESDRLSVIEGFPWFNDSGRAALQSLPGLALTTRRFRDSKAILMAFAERRQNGLIANRTLDSAKQNRLVFASADVSLWYAWALYHHYRITKDKDLVKTLMPVLIDIFKRFSATTGDIKVSSDGLLDTGSPTEEYSWMDAKIGDLPITPRAGKAVELNALWYNFLETVLYLDNEVQFALPEQAQIKAAAELAKQSMIKFWNEDKQCLFDVIEARNPSGNSNKGHDDAIRPNQLLAVSLPFRAFSKPHERAILNVIETELLTPTGLRTLAVSDPQYQGVYGCGFQHADQYHRDLSYHQGTVWTWLIGSYFEALTNVFGTQSESIGRVKLLLQPFLAHLTEEACLGSISEIFDGSRPHLAKGCPTHAVAIAECMRWQAWQLKQ
ncbi:amylo-alpha-1,6-glucosidase [soil metagenome]